MGYIVGYALESQYGFSGYQMVEQLFSVLLFALAIGIYWLDKKTGGILQKILPKKNKYEINAKSSEPAKKDTPAYTSKLEGEKKGYARFEDEPESANQQTEFSSKNFRQECKLKV